MLNLTFIWAKAENFHLGQGFQKTGYVSLQHMDSLTKQDIPLDPFPSYGAASLQCCVSCNVPQSAKFDVNIISQGKEVCKQSGPT